MSPNSFHEANIILITKLKKRKIDTNTLNNHLQTKYNNTLKGLYARIKLVSFHGHKADLAYQ
jgi:hypothetical protein